MKKDKTEIEEITARLIKFRDERNWEQFHNSKDLALALSIEAAELNELFLWKSSEDVNEVKLKEELAVTEKKRDASDMFLKLFGTFRVRLKKR